MAREDLIPLNRRTKDEQKKIARMGGIASGAARRERKTASEIAKAIAELRIKDPKLLQRLEREGIKKSDRTYLTTLILSMYTKAIAKGDVNAAKFIVELLGDMPTSNYDDTEPVQVVVDV